MKAKVIRQRSHINSESRRDVHTSDSFTIFQKPWNDVVCEVKVRILGTWYRLKDEGINNIYRCICHRTSECRCDRVEVGLLFKVRHKTIRLQFHDPEICALPM